MDLSDKTLHDLQKALDSANDGDGDAFGELINRFELRFRQLVKKMLSRYPHVRRWEATDDIFQASIIRLHQSLTGAKPTSVREFVGLAATQIRRTLIDLARHYFGKQGHGANYNSAGGGKAADDPGGPVDRLAVNNNGPENLEDWTAFHEATRLLPDQPREVFELTWYAGLNQSEIAELLDLSRRDNNSEAKRSPRAVNQATGGLAFAQVSRWIAQVEFQN